MTIKVMITEDHDHTRQGLVYGLDKYENIEIIAEAINGEEAVEFANKFKPDVILMDIMMPVLNGIKATEKIKSVNNDIKIIMLTSYNEKKEVLSAFNSGANAYCMKNIMIDDLANVIKMVMEGTLWIDSSIAGYILEILQSGSSSEAPQEKAVSECTKNLTNREKEILKLIATGLNNKDISEKLCLSLHTVKNHVRSIIHKLAVNDRTQATIIALRENLI